MFIEFRMTTLVIGIVAMAALRMVSFWKIYQNLIRKQNFFKIWNNFPRCNQHVTFVGEGDQIIFRFLIMVCMEGVGEIYEANEIP